MRGKKLAVVALVTTVVVVSLSALAWFFVLLPWLRSLRNPYREAAKTEQVAKDESQDKDEKAKDKAEDKDEKATDKDDKADGTESENPDAPQVDAVDVSNVDFDVAAMDDAAAFDFMHDFLNRTPDEHAADFGKVMHIKGQVGRYSKIEDDGEKVSYSVGVKGEDGVIWAINFYVRGWTGDDYPEHQSIVEVTGEYGEVEGYGTNAGKTLICNPEDVKLLEE